ncbi:MAG: hypothetical protein K2M76_00935 [Muribaculaceae bacterium]|nr:hypothetical protein [Muribaculaceae bacterium]
MIDKAGVHYGLYLYDPSESTVQPIDDEVHSAVHVNGILVAGLDFKCVDAGSDVHVQPVSSPSECVAALWRRFADSFSDSLTFLAFDFSGCVIAL